MKQNISMTSIALLLDRVVADSRTPGIFIRYTERMKMLPYGSPQPLYYISLHCTFHGMLGALLNT